MGLISFNVANSAFGIGVLALLTLCIRYCFKSKCTHIRLCYGFCDIERDAAAENEEPELPPDGGVAPPSPTPIRRASRTAHLEVDNSSV